MENISKKGIARPKWFYWWLLHFTPKENITKGMKYFGIIYMCTWFVCSKLLNIDKRSGRRPK